MRGQRPSLIDALERQAVVWLSSIRPDGRPHVVPVWFAWDGAAIHMFSKPHAQKVRNIRHDPRVMLAVGEPGVEFDVELIEATAACPTKDGRACHTPDLFVRKYAELLGRAGLTAERFLAVYSQPILIYPTRWLGWGGPGWADQHPRAAPPSPAQHHAERPRHLAPSPVEPPLTRYGLLRAGTPI